KMRHCRIESWSPFEIVIKDHVKPATSLAFFYCAKCCLVFDVIDNNVQKIAGGVGTGGVGTLGKGTRVGSNKFEESCWLCKGTSVLCLNSLVEDLKVMPTTEVHRVSSKDKNSFHLDQLNQLQLRKSKYPGLQEGANQPTIKHVSDPTIPYLGH